MRRRPAESSGERFGRTIPRLGRRRSRRSIRIGDRRLTRALVGLLETDSAEIQDGRAVLDRLADDDDPWIARLGRVVASGESEMPDTSRTIGDLETMLFLRRVPLFEGLAPEDLQRIAMTAVERLYLPGEALFREGDLGQELVVVIEGSVRVVHVEPDGTERLLTRYGAGDHIGELAVLREAPRAATVVAEAEGVRRPRDRWPGDRGDPAGAAPRPRWRCSRHSPSG